MRAHWAGGPDGDRPAPFHERNRHRVPGYEPMFYGTIDGATVHPREVVKAVLRLNAAAVIFGHCHPSGVAEPSLADQSITRRLKE